MGFTINACSPSLSFDDQGVIFYQTLMLSILSVYIFLILIFRIGSALKNHDLHSLQVHNKKTVIPVENIAKKFITNIIKYQKQTLKNKEVDKIEQNFQVAKSKNQGQISQMSQSSSQNSSVSNQQNEKQGQQLIYQKWFINVSQLKITFQQFIECYSLIFEFSFISIGLVIANFPFFYSFLLCFIQFSTVVILILQSILSKKFTQINQQKSSNKKFFSREMQNKSKKSVFRISGLIIISVTNLGLIILSIFGINMSFYSTITLKCLN